MSGPALRRLFLLFVVALGLAPGTWVRSERPALVLDAGLAATRIPLEQGRIGPLVIDGAWVLESRNSLFGGYSSLVALPDGTLLSGSDKGAALRFRLGENGPRDAKLTPFGGKAPGEDKIYSDLEALTGDPATGRIWGAYEYLNSIVRFDTPDAAPQAVEPEGMANWPANAGPEALVRLADGRFIALAEGTRAWLDANHNGLLFAGDPVEGAAARSFTFRPPQDYRPVDMALLPDGRVLILVRLFEWGLPPSFRARLLVADSAEISPGEPWPWTELARIEPPLPTDNYEGLAVSGEDYPVKVRIISDDNTAKFQRTLLLDLTWDGQMPAAREKARRP